MRNLFWKVVSYWSSHVRFLDVCIVALVLVTAQMNLNLTSRVARVVERMIEFHHEDDTFIKEILGMFDKLVGITRDINTAATGEAGKRLAGSPNRIADVDDLKARLTALEKALGQSPEKAVLGLTLRKDIENLQDRYKGDIASLRDELKRSEDISKVFIALLAAGILVPLLRPHKNE